VAIWVNEWKNGDYFANYRRTTPSDKEIESKLGSFRAALPMKLVGVSLLSRKLFARRG